MVTKHILKKLQKIGSSVLAKILMVTKHGGAYNLDKVSSVLAKILMVTKQQIFLASARISFCSSKNPYGNKTLLIN